MNRITPEVIIDRCATRLRERYEDLECIVYSPKGYEKWVQWELFLSFMDDCAPCAYDEEYKELRLKDGQIIADIGLEYSGKIRQHSFRIDMWIVEKPFLFPLVEEGTWGLFDKAKQEKAKNDYGSAFNHYVELKTEWWDINKDPEKLISDLDKFTIAELAALAKSRKGKTYIAMTVATF